MWKVASLCLVSTVLTYVVCSQKTYTETFYSPPVTLSPGQVANTDATVFGPLDWPQKPIAVTYFDSEVVDEQGNAVALYDLYIHHYLIYVNLGKFSAGPCYGLMNIWGIGAEMRGEVYDYPYPYAVVFDGTENFTANLHFIRTDTVPQDDHQLCIECHCSDGTPENPHGGIACCEDNSFCWGMPNTTVDPVKFYLKYTMKYTDVTDDIKPLTAFSYDVMATENYDCAIEYQVSSESVADGTENVRRNTSTVLQDTEIIYVEVHQHIGGTNYTVEHWRDGQFLGVMCSAVPQYGNGTEVGNEAGYVVKIPACRFDADSPYLVKKGDELIFTSYYDGRHIAGGGDYHEGVMGLVLYWGTRTGPSECESKLKELCGDPLPASTDECYACAMELENKSELYFSDCGADYGWREVYFLCITDNGVKTPYPINGTDATDATDDNIREITKDMRKMYERANISDIAAIERRDGRLRMKGF